MKLQRQHVKNEKRKKPKIETLVKTLTLEEEEEAYKKIGK